MIFRAILTYHPHVGTFRGTRGAWRVERCYRDVDMPLPPRAGYTFGRQQCDLRVLFMSVARYLPRGTWTNPTKLLREMLARQRIANLTKEKAA